MNTNTVAQSDYAANAYTENVQQTTKKSAVTNGKTIGDPQLSEKAQKYYEQLKKKFSNMDFILVSADKKEEAQANAAQYANANHTVVPVSYTHLDVYKRQMQLVGINVITRTEVEECFAVIDDEIVWHLSLIHIYNVQIVGMTGFVLNNVKRRYFVMNVKIPNG